jgi:hypothetical protein
MREVGGSGRVRETAHRDCDIEGGAKAETWKLEDRPILLVSATADMARRIVQESIPFVVDWGVMVNIRLEWIDRMLKDVKILVFVLGRNVL